MTTTALTNSQLRQLKARAQHLEPMFKIGKAGLSPGFVQSVSAGLDHHELIKVKFVEFKEEKDTLAPQLAEQTASHVVMRVGHVLVLYRAKPTAATPLTG